MVLLWCLIWLCHFLCTLFSYAYLTYFLVQRIHIGFSPLFSELNIVLKFIEFISLINMIRGLSSCEKKGFEFDILVFFKSIFFLYFHNRNLDNATKSHLDDCLNIASLLTEHLNLGSNSPCHNHRTHNANE